MMGMVQAQLASRRNDLRNDVFCRDRLKMLLIERVDSLHFRFGRALQQNGVVNRAALNASQGRFANKRAVITTRQARNFKVLENVLFNAEKRLLRGMAKRRGKFC